MMSKQSNRDELLNDVLGILAERDRGHANLVWEIEAAYYKRKGVVYDDTIRMKELLDKLCQDNHIERHEYNNKTDIGYTIKHDGRFFLEDGGYKSQKIFFGLYFSPLSVLEFLLGAAALTATIYYIYEMLRH